MLPRLVKVKVMGRASLVRRSLAKSLAMDFIKKLSKVFKGPLCHKRVFVIGFL